MDRKLYVIEDLSNQTKRILPHDILRYPAERYLSVLETAKEKMLEAYGSDFAFLDETVAVDAEIAQQ